MNYEFSLYAKWAMLALVVLVTALLIFGSRRSGSVSISNEMVNDLCTSFDELKREACNRDIISVLESEPLDSLPTSQLEILGHAYRKSSDYAGTEFEAQDLQASARGVYSRILDRDTSNSDAAFFLAMMQETEDDTNRMLQDLIQRDSTFMAAYWVLSTNYANMGGDENLKQAHEFNMLAFENAAEGWKIEMAASAFATADRLKQQDDKNRILYELREHFSLEDFLGELRFSGTDGVTAENVVAVRHGVDKYCSANYVQVDAQPCRAIVKLLEVWIPSNPPRQEWKDLLDESRASIQHE